MSELADKIEALAKKQQERGHGPWYIEKEPHDYPDGTTHFTHVRCKGRSGGEEVIIGIGNYLTPDTAELMCTLHNNIPAIVAALRRSS